ncbi:hypothetical protein LZG74_11290 [Dyadobacter sp. CY327]|uniref:hypothetical protein n=1 Tax=Dyadobacter sp. CY327 TaxID=2907301 RepID=UPI001F2BB7F8|nr:hypothetical protein [Dyadobacter sp. CY327]MCE7070891.1 hypothetical protein [Dyadobacter sp. CY327]
MSEKPVSNKKTSESGNTNFWASLSNGDIIGIASLLLTAIAIVTAITNEEIRAAFDLRKDPNASERTLKTSEGLGEDPEDDSNGYNGDQVLGIDTTGQYVRYHAMIDAINDLLAKSTKGYEVFDKYIRSHDDCDAVAEAIKINTVVGTSLKMLVKNIYADDALREMSKFNIKPINNLVSEIDEWEDEYSQITDKNKSPCKMAMFPPMQYLMLRDDLIELKSKLKSKLAEQGDGGNQ